MTSRTSVQIRTDKKLLKQLSKKLKSINNTSVDIGFLGGKKHQESPDFTVAEIAAIHEFGSADGKIPERPFMRQTLDNHENYVPLLAKEAKIVITKKKSAAKVATKIGETVRGDMVLEITDGNFVPNAPSTIAKKGSDKPLIDSGFMRNSIEWRLSK